MSYQFDVAGASNATAGGNTYVHVTLAVGDHPNRVAIVSAGRKQNVDPPALSSVDINGGPPGILLGSGGGAAYEITRHFYLLESSFPSGGGSFTFYARMTGGFADYGSIAVAVFYNVAQQAPVVVASDSNSFATIATPGSGVILSAFGGASGGGSITTEGGIVHANWASPDIAVASQSTPGGNQTMTWSSGAQGASFAAFQNAQSSGGRLVFWFHNWKRVNGLIRPNRESNALKRGLVGI